ncbi:MAG: hemagglutinin repeat-containing protein [Gammaproteobacteria bacterium]
MHVGTAQNEYQYRKSVESQESGVMLGATSPAYDAARSMDESFKNLKTVDNDGLKVLAGMNIATQAANLNEMAQGIQTAWKTEGEMPLDSVVKGTANIGVQMFEDWREVEITKAILPVIETHRFELVLQGKGKDSGGGGMTGVQLKAKEADFDIEGDLHLNAATNERTEVALHRSETVSLGASVGLQGKVSITGQGSQQRTDVNSVDLTHTSTHSPLKRVWLKRMQRRIKIQSTITRTPSPSRVDFKLEKRVLMLKFKGIPLSPVLSLMWRYQPLARDYIISVRVL